MQDQLAERSHDEEGEEPADRVDDGKRGSCLGEPAAGAEEQAGADRAADGDHVDVPGLQGLAVAGVTRVGGGGGRCFGVSQGLFGHGVTRPRSVATCSCARSW